MSCYIVEDICINRIVTTVMSLDEYHTRPLHLARYDINNLGQAMFELNCRSFEERYGKDDLHGFAEDNCYRYKKEECSLLQAYKSLECYLYQSCEGTCDQDQLYLLLSKVLDAMAHELVRRDARYNGMAWG